MLPTIRLEPVSDMERWNIEPVRVLGRPFWHVTCGGNKSIFSKKTPEVFLKNVQILADFSQKRLIFRVKGVRITGSGFWRQTVWPGSNMFFTIRHYSFLKTVGREQKTDTDTSQQYGGILQVSKTCQALGLHPGEFLIIR